MQVTFSFWFFSYMPHIYVDIFSQSEDGGQARMEESLAVSVIRAKEKKHVQGGQWKYVVGRTGA